MCNLQSIRQLIKANIHPHLQYCEATFERTSLIRLSAQNAAARRARHAITEVFKSYPFCTTFNTAPAEWLEESGLQQGRTTHPDTTRPAVKDGSSLSSIRFRSMTCLTSFASDTVGYACLPRRELRASTLSSIDSMT